MRSTEATVRALYRAFFAFDSEGMLAPMHDKVEVRFLGSATLRGKQQTRELLQAQFATIPELDFELTSLIVDEAYAAGIWRETGTTDQGEPWSNHGVDVFEVRDGLIVAMHEHNDVRPAAQR